MPVVARFGTEALPAQPSGDAQQDDRQDSEEDRLRAASPAPCRQPEVDGQDERQQANAQHDENRSQVHAFLLVKL